MHQSEQRALLLKAGHGAVPGIKGMLPVAVRLSDSSGKVKCVRQCKQVAQT